MSSSSSIGIYQYTNTFYTGDDCQPDVLDIFIKSSKKSKIFHSRNNPAATYMGYMPIISCVTGVARVVSAVKIIFIELSQLRTQAAEAHKAEVWNAFKNLLRGVIEVIPLTGIILILFDTVRNHIQIEKIDKSLEEEENIAGIAVDGKIVLKVNLTKIDHFCSQKQTPQYLEKPDQYRLEVFKELCFKILKDSAEKKDFKMGMSQLFLKLEHLNT